VRLPARPARRARPGGPGGRRDTGAGLSWPATRAGRRPLPREPV